MHFLPLFLTNREATILRLFLSNSAGRDIVSARSRRIECHDQLGSCAKCRNKCVSCARRLSAKFLARLVTLRRQSAMNLRDAYIAPEIFAREPYVYDRIVPAHLNSESYTRGFAVTDRHILDSRGANYKYQTIDSREIRILSLNTRPKSRRVI